MKINIKRGDIIWSYLGTATSLSSYIIILPLIVKFLSGELVGLWYIFVSIGAIANLFDFGFTYTFARNITYCWSGSRKLQKTDATEAESTETDFKLMKEILATSKFVYLIIASIALLLLLTVGSLYIFFISKSIPGYDHLIAWGIYSFAIFLNLYFNYYDSFLLGVGAVKRSNQNKVIARLAHIVVLIILLLCGTGIIGATAAYLTYGTVFRWLGKHYFYRYEGICEKLKEITEPVRLEKIRELFLTIWHNAWRDGIIQLTIYATDQATVLICSAFMSLTETGIYSIALQIATAVAMISSVLYNTYQPQLQASYVSRDTARMKKTMRIIVWSLLILFSFGTLGSIVVAFPLLQYVRPGICVSIPVFLGISLSQLLLRYRNCYTTYFSATNRIIYMRSFVVSAIACLGLSFVFLSYFHMGVWGIILAQIVSQMMFNVWYWPLKAKREMATPNATHCVTE